MGTITVLPTAHKHPYPGNWKWQAENGYPERVQGQAGRAGAGQPPQPTMSREEEFSVRTRWISALRAPGRAAGAPTAGGPCARKLVLVGSLPTRQVGAGRRPARSRLAARRPAGDLEDHAHGTVTEFLGALPWGWHGWILSRNRSLHQTRGGSKDLADLVFARSALRDGWPLVPDETRVGFGAAYGVGVAGVLAFLLRLRNYCARLWTAAPAVQLPAA